MKLIDGIVAFFTTIFDGVFGFFGIIKKGLEWVVNNRAAMVAVVVGAVKSVYDFTVSQLNNALAGFDSITGDLTHVDGGSAVGDFLAFGNCIFPLSETMAIAILLFELWMVCAVIKLILRLIPMI